MHWHDQKRGCTHETHGYSSFPMDKAHLTHEAKLMARYKSFVFLSWLVSPTGWWAAQSSSRHSSSRSSSLPHRVVDISIANIIIGSSPSPSHWCRPMLIISCQQQWHGGKTRAQNWWRGKAEVNRKKILLPKDGWSLLRANRVWTYIFFFPRFFVRY